MSQLPPSNPTMMYLHKATESIFELSDNFNKKANTIDNLIADVKFCRERSKLENEMALIKDISHMTEKFLNKSKSGCKYNESIQGVKMKCEKQLAVIENTDIHNFNKCSESIFRILKLTYYKKKI